MKGNKEVKISYLAAHLTTIVSVTMVLLLIGIIALISAAAAGESRRIREKIELSMVMCDSVSDAAADSVCALLKQRPYVKTAKVITSRQALESWRDATGEDLEKLFGVNPLSPEIAFTLKAEYTAPAQVASISRQLSKIPEVEEVGSPDMKMMQQMNDNINFLAMILGGIALVMIVISFVLINNTVHLAIYSRRFTIHTMQLVGATSGFIRRPFILNNMMSGVVAGTVASAVIATALACAPHAGLTAAASYISWTDFAIIAAGLIVAGALICALAAWLATGKYLRKDYDALFS